MKQECAKCKTMCDNGSLLMEMCKYYFFCKICSDVLEKNPSISVLDYLGGRMQEDYHNRIQISIREARERRANGVFWWASG